MDTYATYRDLQRHETRGTDYDLVLREGTSGIAIMAPHGGGIEPGTLDIADALAGGEHTFYAFKGIKPAGNPVLHLTCTRFDEPLGVAVAHGAEVVLTVHGCSELSETVFVGGRHEELKAAICTALTAAGFRAVVGARPGLQAVKRENLCNRGQSGRGVQLEISVGLRRKLLIGLNTHQEGYPTPLFALFVMAIRQVLALGQWCRPHAPQVSEPLTSGGKSD
jgi:phage replication-related protein YjqB (UPF0714/DUF867 family)